MDKASDGDTARITWHTTKLPYFEAKMYESPFKKFHCNYAEGERGLYGKGDKPVEWVNMTNADILAGCIAAGIGKDNVAKYTANSQKFQQAYLGDSKVKGFKFKVGLLNMWVQDLAMNTIKHKAGADDVVSELWYGPIPKEGAKEYVAKCIKAFEQYLVDQEIDEEIDAMQFFKEVRAAMAMEQPNYILALSKDRDPGTCAESPIAGAGTQADAGNSMMRVLWSELEARARLGK